LSEYGVKLKPKKRRVNYLGRIMPAAGYKLHHSNVEGVRTLKDSKPCTVSGVKKLLGVLCTIAGISRTLLGFATHSSSF